MALVCVSPRSLGIRFEFIDCSTISISYDRRGLATVSFTVVSSDNTMQGSYTDLVFGGVRFKGTISSVDISRISGTTAYEFRLSLFAFGC